MLPTRIAQSFATLPADLIGLCRPHNWADLTRPPAEGMRSIRDILVHTMGTEAGWIGHVVRGMPDRPFKPDELRDLDAILAVWAPQRAATMAFVRSLTAEQWSATRPLIGWDENQTATVADIVWHVVTHDQYHRGQIFSRLALLGRRDLPDYDMLR
jgi:uncharacterized damage-inducible protein DinB